MSRRQIIIDTDGGTDDALAVIIALQDQNTDVVALTTVHGNISAEQATVNAATLVRLFCLPDKDGKSPKKRIHRCTYEGKELPLIFRGSAEALVKHGTRMPPNTWPGNGKDGLGGANFDEELTTKPEVKIQSEHAVMGLINLAQKNPGVYDLICLGPLTNIALACRLDPKFPTNVKSMTIMGGSTEGRGNSGLASEFNFRCDPEAAQIVLSVWGHNRLQMTLIGWELTEKMFIHWDDYRKIVSHETFTSYVVDQLNIETKKLGNISDLILQDLQKLKLSESKQTQLPTGTDEQLPVLALDPPPIRTETTTPQPTQKGKSKKMDFENMDEFNYLTDSDADRQYVTCDPMAMIALLFPETIIRTREVYATVELSGEFSYGALLQDYYRSLRQAPNLIVVTALDKKKILEILNRTTSS